MNEEQESQEPLTLTGQFIIGRKGDSSVYLERNNPTQDIFAPAQWAAAKQQIEAKGMRFLGVVHAFSNNDTGALSAVANTDSPVPSAEETELMNQAMLDARYLPLVLENLQDSRVQQMLALCPLDCKECTEGKPLCL
jgi:hypothetical protein